MTARTVTIWTCEVCGVSEEKGQGVQPLGWGELTWASFNSGAASDSITLCRHCAYRWRPTAPVDDRPMLADATQGKGLSS